MKKPAHRAAAKSRSKGSRPGRGPGDDERPSGPRPSWRGLISFGLVNVPVNLYPAVKPEIHGMNYLRKDDLCPIAYKKVCRATGEEVPFDDIVKGYEYRDGDYVVLADEDFRKADVRKSSAIEIEAFVDEAEIDPKYVEKPYYLEPQPKAHTAYALFRDAMAQSKKVAIGLFVLRDREHLVMLKPEGRAILLVQLRFAASLRASAGLDLPPARVEAPKAQMELALELVKKFAGEFRPEAYTDTYAARLREIIAAKARGRTVHVRAEEAPRETEVEDIMSRLKESLAATRH
jgi:DNA end-binding protein Ku